MILAQAVLKVVRSQASIKVANHVVSVIGFTDCVKVSPGCATVFQIASINCRKSGRFSVIGFTALSISHQKTSYFDVSFMINDQNIMFPSSLNRYLQQFLFRS